MKTAAQLKKGEKAIIRQLTNINIAPILLALGVRPGLFIKFVRSAPFGCSIYFNIDGNHFILRKTDAKSINVS